MCVGTYLYVYRIILCSGCEDDDYHDDENNKYNIMYKKYIILLYYRWTAIIRRVDDARGLYRECLYVYIIVIWMNTF